MAVSSWASSSSRDANGSSGNCVATKRPDNRVLTSGRGASRQIPNARHQPAGNGGDIYKQLRSLDTGRKTPVIFVSARPKFQLEQMLPPDPLVRFVEKPVDVGELGAFIIELLGPQAAPPQHL